MSGLSRRSLGIGALGGLIAVGACGARPERRTPGSPRADLYACEGCEATAERDPSALSSAAVLAGPGEPGQRMILTGRVVGVDGVTPAAGVILYAHHTNAQGLYANGSEESVWSRRHGRLRGWVKTGPDGLYRFETIKPEPYPDRTLPAHVHLFLKEPGRGPYYIDDVVFEGEFKVDAAYRAAQELRGGSGIVRPVPTPDGGIRVVRDIRLEAHP